jgi:hypothetical protein
MSYKALVTNGYARRHSAQEKQDPLGWFAMAYAHRTEPMSRLQVQSPAIRLYQGPNHGREKHIFVSDTIVLFVAYRR